MVLFEPGGVEGFGLTSIARVLVFGCKKVRVWLFEYS